jgi:hypothetical protein
MGLWGLFPVLALVVLLSLGSGAAWAGDDDFDAGEIDPDLPAKIKTWNADCLSCHSQRGVEHPPRQGMDLALLAKLTVPQDHFEQSDHGKMACKDCHGEPYVPYPHLPNAKKQIKDCVTCHQAPAKTIMPEFKASTHFKGHSERFTCLSCHDSHTMKKGSKLPSAKAAAVQDNGVCLTCHDNDKPYLDLMKPGSKRPDMAKAHSWLPEMALHLEQARCIDCHSPTADAGSLSHEVQGKDKALRSCEACHGEGTQLGMRLYKARMRDGDTGWGGFVNAPLLNEIYVVGANRNRWLDWAGAGILGLTAAGLAVRVFLRRRKGKGEPS